MKKGHIYREKHILKENTYIEEHIYKKKIYIYIEKHKYGKIYICEEHYKNVYKYHNNIKKRK